jgi:hypothetical protein
MPRPSKFACGLPEEERLAAAMPHPGRRARRFRVNDEGSFDTGGFRLGVGGSGSTCRERSVQPDHRLVDFQRRMITFLSRRVAVH